VDVVVDQRKGSDELIEGHAGSGRQGRGAFPIAC
jgi:hypothetical protein